MKMPVIIDGWSEIPPALLACSSVVSGGAEESSLLPVTVNLGMFSVRQS